MNDLRIALFTGNYNHIPDGVSLTLNRLVGYLEKQHIPVLVFGPSVKEPGLRHNGELVVAPSVPVPVSNRGEYRFTVGFPKRLKKRLENFNPALVHIATPDLLGYKALKWAKKHDIPVVASYHTHFSSYLQYYKFGFLEKLLWKYLRWFYGQCTNIYVPTESMAAVLKQNGIKDGLRIWARGVDTALFNPDKRSEIFREKAGFSKTDTVVTFVSRLVWEKELRTFIESVKNVQQTNPEVKALVVGDGPAMDEARTLLPDAFFAGFLKGEELAAAYASSDVFLFPSHTETFGNVTLEAMSSGLPCLVADAIGSKSLVVDGENGLWAEKKNVSDFTEKLRTIVSSRELMKNMGSKSRQLALTYEWEAINKGLVDHYKDVVYAGELI